MTDVPSQADTYFFEEDEMKQTIKHSSVERVTYEFDLYDIRRALLMSEGIKEYDSKRHLEFDIREDDDGKFIATIAIVFEEPKEEDND